MFPFFFPSFFPIIDETQQSARIYGQYQSSTYFHARTLYEMKKICPLLLGLFAFGVLSAQSNSSETYGEQVARTKLALFEKDLSPSSQEKDSLKLKYANYMAEVSCLLDTLDLSNRKKQRLLLELNRNPLSEKVQKVVALVEEK